MPEFYDQGSSTYQLRAQPYLDAIARGIRCDPLSRAFLLKGTEFETSYDSAESPWQAQRERREPKKEMKGPFWSNYWYKPCKSCNCRIDDSVSMEIDAIFFLRNEEQRTLVIHIEMKRDGEEESHGALLHKSHEGFIL